MDKETVLSECHWEWEYSALVDWTDNSCISTNNIDAQTKLTSAANRMFFSAQEL